MIPKHLIEQAISAAISQDWHKARDVNLEILQHDPYHIPTLNRLAKAYRETNQVDKAVKTYEQTLALDKYNNIAQKNLTLLRTVLGGQNHTNDNKKQYNTDFIDEPGLTRTLPLVRLGDPQLITTLEPGQIMGMLVRNHNICIVTHNNHHVGALTDDVAFHLKRFVEQGYEYQITVKSIGQNKISVFIKEISRPDSTQHNPTFCF